MRQSSRLFGPGGSIITSRLRRDTRKSGPTVRKIKCAESAILRWNLNEKLLWDQIQLVRPSRIETPIPLGRSPYNALEPVSHFCVCGPEVKGFARAIMIQSHLIFESSLRGLCSSQLVTFCICDQYRRRRRRFASEIGSPEAGQKSFGGYDRQGAHHPSSSRGSVGSACSPWLTDTTVADGRCCRKRVLRLAHARHWLKRERNTQS